MKEKEEIIKSGGRNSIFISMILLIYAMTVFFILFGINKIHSHDFFVPVLIFCVIDLLVLVLLVAECKRAIHTIGFIPYVSICVLTGIYLAIQYLHHFITYQGLNRGYYIVFKLISIMIYSTVVVAITAFYKIQHK